MTLHQKHIDWIEARGLDVELAVKLGISTVKDDGGYWLSVPYIEYERTVNHKYRQTAEKRHRMDANAALCLWNHDVLLEDSTSPVVITEGEWDAMAAMQCGFPRSLSVPNGAPKAPTEDMTDPETARYQFLWRSRELLGRVAVFVIATDADGPGRALAADLARWLGAERCKFATYPDGCKDLNEVLQAHGANAVRRVIDGAKEYPVKGLYTVDDFPEPPDIEPIRHRVPVLSEYLPIVPGTLTVGTGYAASGKTSLVVRVIADVLAAGHVVALGSFETAVKPILARKLRAALCHCGEYADYGPAQAAADALVRERLRIISQMMADDDSDMTLEEILELARVAVLRDGAKFIILDPWNEIDHKRGRDETETDYASRAIRMMKRFARNYDVALWVIAHPAKPQFVGGKLPIPSLYSIAGSAHWANKPDYGFVVNRPHKDGDDVDVHVTKVRMGLPGKMAKVTLTYHWRESRYVDASAAA